MKKAVLVNLTLICSGALFAQENPVFDRESFFSQFDYSTAPTGLLRDLSAQEPVDCVNPFIGTTNFGACNPGAVTPTNFRLTIGYILETIEFTDKTYMQ